VNSNCDCEKAQQTLVKPSVVKDRRYCNEAALTILKFAEQYGLHEYGNEAAVCKNESRSNTPV
jgi:hypothetical protein